MKRRRLTKWLAVFAGWLLLAVPALCLSEKPPWAGESMPAQLESCEDELTTCLENAVAFPATGQTSCWDSDGIPIDCLDTGQDGDIQAGGDLSYTDTGLTIIDNNTKLEWMKQDDNGGGCASPAGSLDKDCVFTWDNAFNFVDQLNTEPCFANACDWRVPNIKELQSIVNYENDRPAVSEAFHDAACVAGCTVNACSCTAGAFFWSSTSSTIAPGGAWIVSFGGGDVIINDKDGTRRVRAVRGGL